MDRDQFGAATGLSATQVARWYEPVENAMFEFAIVSTARAAMFLATIGHESGGFRWTSEIWGPTTAQRRYDSRADLGNTRPEAVRIAAAHDSTPGSWWRGWGLIQITGFDNMRVAGEALGLDLLNEPSLLGEPRPAARSAAWWWKENGCNELADAGDFLAVSRRVNLGNAKSTRTPNGWDDRLKRYNIARAAL